MNKVIGLLIPAAGLLVGCAGSVVETTVARVERLERDPGWAVFAELPSGETIGMTSRIPYVVGDRVCVQFFSDYVLNEFEWRVRPCSA